MIPSFIRHAFVNGEQATLIPIHRLHHVRHEIEGFTQHEQLNGFQKWIVHDMYNFDVPKTEFSVKSILLMAIPHPFYASVEFCYHGKTYRGLSLVMSDFDTAEQHLKKVLRTANYHMIAAQNIPLKRLAVHSGFAVYGRNNICYIDGLGSNFSFIAYFSDIPCDDAYWTNITTASLCTQCRARVRRFPSRSSGTSGGPLRDRRIGREMRYARIEVLGGPAAPPDQLNGASLPRRVDFCCATPRPASNGTLISRPLAILSPA